ncbi:MAG: HEAT repeat domain-containing protein, partial [Rubripirellula sp.]
SNPIELLALRLVAANALSRTGPNDQLALAKQLLAEPSRPEALHALLAVAVIDKDDSDGAVELLQQLVSNKNSVVQGHALGHLYRIDYKLVEPFCEELVASPDSNVRRWCALTLIDGRRIDRIPLLSSLMNDVNPTLRRDVSAALVELGQDEALEPAVIEASEKIIARDDWRACEQACVVLAKLDHKPSGPRMVELLGHPRGDVQVASAWGLAQLRIPELLPDMLDHAESVYEGFRSGQLNYGMPGAEEHVAHLFNAFGDQRYMPAEPLIMKYIPKDHSLGFESRPAAVWALGMFYEDNVKDELVPILLGRLRDGGGLDPESEVVCRMSGISLGRMKAEQAVDGLLPFTKQYGSLGQACRWSVQRINGEAIPAPIRPPNRTTIDDWFLMPLPKQ